MIIEWEGFIYLIIFIVYTDMSKQCNAKPLYAVSHK